MTPRTAAPHRPQCRPPVGPRRQLPRLSCWRRRRATCPHQALPLLVRIPSDRLAAPGLPSLQGLQDRPWRRRRPGMLAILPFLPAPTTPTPSTLPYMTYFPYQHRPRCTPPRACSLLLLSSAWPTSRAGRLRLRRRLRACHPPPARRRPATRYPPRRARLTASLGATSLTSWLARHPFSNNQYRNHRPADCTAATTTPAHFTPRGRGGGGLAPIRLIKLISIIPTMTPTCQAFAQAVIRATARMTTRRSSSPDQPLTRGRRDRSGVRPTGLAAGAGRRLMHSSNHWLGTRVPNRTERPTPRWRRPTCPHLRWQVMATSSPPRLRCARQLRCARRPPRLMPPRWAALAQQRLGWTTRARATHRAPRLLRPSCRATIDNSAMGGSRTVAKRNVPSVVRDREQQVRVEGLPSLNSCLLPGRTALR